MSKIFFNIKDTKMTLHFKEYFDIKKICNGRKRIKGRRT